MKATKASLLRSYALAKDKAMLPGVIVALLGFGVAAARGASPVITSEPNDVSKFVGENAAFTVGVSNPAGIQFQWYFAGSPLASRTNATLQLADVTTNVAGGYYVVLTNTDGGATSRLATLGVTQPSYEEQAISGLYNMTAYRGQTGRVVNVTVTASANGGSLWGTGIYTDDSSLATAAVHAGWLADNEVGTLMVEVLPGYDAYLGSTSHGVTSTSYGHWVGSYQIVGLGPTFTMQPGSRAAWDGATVSLQAQAVAHSAPHYRWAHNGLAMPGQTNAVLTLSNVTSAAAGTYAVTAWTSQGTNTSAPATLVVIAPSFGSPAVPAPYYASELGTLDGEVYRVIVTGVTNAGPLYGTGFYTVDSMLGLAAVHSGMIAPGEVATLALLMLPGQSWFLGSTQNGLTSLSRSYYYRAFAFLALTPTITQQPLAQAVLPGGSASFSVAATSGAMPLSYQWRHDGTPLPGKTLASLTLNSVTALDAGQYDVAVSSPDGSTLSIPATLALVPPNVRPQPAISPCSATNGAVLFATVVGTTNGALWGDGVYTCDSYLATAAVHAGWLAPAQSATVAILVMPGQNQYYSTTRHGVTSTAYGSWYRSFSFIGLAPSIVSQPQGQTVSEGATAVFAVAATSSAPLNYSWSKDGTPLGAANAETLVIQNVTANDAGQYSVIVSNQLGFATSLPAVLTVNGGATLRLDLVAPGLLSLQGTTGVTWQIQSRDRVDAGPWQPLTNLLLKVSPSPFTDVHPLSTSNRFYRAQRAP